MVTRSRKQRRGAGSRPAAKKERWRATDNPVATFVPPGTLQRDAAEIARVLASPEVCPKGPGSAIRLLQFVLNRTGRTLAPARRRELEKAKRMLQGLQVQRRAEAAAEPVARRGRAGRSLTQGAARPTAVRSRPRGAPPTTC